jgi:hypothetical protein
MKTVFRLVLLTLIVVSVAFCVQQWTQEEKENAEHFLKSLSLVIEAHSNSNKGGPGVMSTQDFGKNISLYQRAFDEENLVRDDVLDKIHPELKNNYRLISVRTLIEQIQLISRKGLDVIGDDVVK